MQKFLAEAGIASRRKCEELIIQGKVKVNGKIAELGMKINPNKDKILLDGKPIKKDNINKVYILLNKPEGYVTTARDQFDRNTVMDLVNVKERVVPVGRLDMYTSGALILSNDGEFVFHITHPKHEIEKTYIAKVNGKIDEKMVEKLKSGVKIDNYITRPAKVKILKYDENKKQTEVEIKIHEGKNRQVRKMLESIGKKTICLERIQIGDLNIRDLKRGQWRYLKAGEVDKLLNQ